MKKTFVTLAVSMLFATGVYAQQSNGCAPNAANCTGTNQSNSGDVTNPGQSSSAATQLGNSTASNASGITADPRSQVTQDANNTTTGTISGGNTTSGATGGQANGNQSSNDNRSSVGNTASNSGGNTLSTGASTSSVGNTSAKGGAGGSANVGPTTATGGTGTGGSSSSRATGGTAAGGTAAQGQHQGQQQAATANGTNTSRNTSALTGGNSGASNGQNVGNGQSTTIGGSSYSDNSRTIFIPPVAPVPPSVVGIGNVIQSTLACGPLQRVEKTPIIATNFGIFHDGHQQQGFTYDLAPVVDVAGQPVEYRYEWMPNGDQRIIGSQVTMFATVVAVSSAQSLTLGGGGGSGSWGQAGGGSSGSMSQLVTNIQVRDCEIGFNRFVPLLVTPAPVIETPREVLKRRIIRPRKIKGCAPKA